MQTTKYSQRSIARTKTARTKAQEGQDEEEIVHPLPKAVICRQSVEKQGSSAIFELNSAHLLERAMRSAKQIMDLKQGGLATVKARLVIAVGERIQQLREAKGMTRNCVAQELNVEAEHIYLLEHGLLSVEEVTELLDLLFLSFCDLQTLWSIPDSSQLQGSHRRQSHRTLSLLEIQTILTSAAPNLQDEQIELWFRLLGGEISVFSSEKPR